MVSVTVVDNGSDDGTVEAVRARRDGTRVIDMGLNTGFAVANNAGMARGTGRYVLMLNPDTVVGPGALRTLVEFADRHRDAGVVAPACSTPTDPPAQRSGVPHGRGGHLRPPVPADPMVSERPVVPGVLGRAGAG